MGKLRNALEYQCKTKYAKEAKDCIEIYDKLKEMNNGHVWSSQWTPLVEIAFGKSLNSKKTYKPNSIGYIFLKGLHDS